MEKYAINQRIQLLLRWTAMLRLGHPELPIIKRKLNWNLGGCPSMCSSGAGNHNTNLDSSGATGVVKNYNRDLATRKACYPHVDFWSRSHPWKNNPFGPPTKMWNIGSLWNSASSPEKPEAIYVQGDHVYHWFSKRPWCDQCLVGLWKIKIEIWASSCS